MELYSLCLLYSLIFLIVLVVAWKVDSKNPVPATAWLVVFLAGAYVLSYVLDGFGLGAGNATGRQIYFGLLAVQLVFLGLCLLKNDCRINWNSLIKPRQ